MSYAREQKHKLKTTTNKIKEHNIWKLGTWNIRSILGKEKELEEEFDKSEVKILTITETKKKGHVIIKIENGHILVHSSVEKSKRAAAGVACLIHKNIVPQIED